jgi:acyl dehydratase
MNQQPTLSSVKIGDVLPPLQLPPVNRTALALFAGASGDHNPIHIDIDFARKAGMPDVIAHGMLGMAQLGRLITNWAPQAQLRRFDARFLGITHLGNAITYTGKVVGRTEQGVRVEVRSITQYGQDKIAGEAFVALK